MSNTKNLANLASVLDDGTSGQVLQSTGSGGVQFADSTGSGVTVHTNQAAMLTDAASASEGTLHYETDNNKLYVKQTSGFYLLASITNSSPTINSFSENTGGAGANNLTSGGTFTLTSGSNTVVTINATDPDLETIVYSATVTSGTATDVFSSPSFPVTNQSSNVFTLTPVTSGNGGTVTIRFDASDGTNVANVSHSFELVFQITDSHYTSLLVATDAAAGDNNDITDSSSNSYTITASGDAHAGTFSPYRHGGYSAYFDGTGDYLTVPDNADWDLGSSDFTIEAWVYPTASPIQPIIIGQWTSSYAWVLLLSNDGNRYLRSLLRSGGSFNDYVSTSALDLNSWNHCALVREGNTVSLYLNGSRVYTTSFTGSVDASTSAVSIGANSAGGSPFQGYLSQTRVVVGTALYSGASYTVPTEPLTAVTNTKLLTCHLPYIADGSSNGHTITVNGNTSTEPIGPYNYAEYSESNNGGSLYFDGTGDYVRISSIADLSGGSYTIEGWYYFEADPNSSNTAFWALNTASQTGYAWLFTSGTTLYIQQRGSGTYTSSGTYDFDVNRWYHIASVWNNSANTMRVYVNGEQVISNTVNAIQNAGNGFTLGADGYGSNLITGFVSDFRIKQTAEYTAEFTPPSSPLSSSSTVLHIKGTDAHVLDKSQGNNLKLVGNAAAVTNATNNSNISSTNAVYFDGSGDYAQLPNFLAGHTGDLTIEAWVYHTSFGQFSNPIITSGDSGSVGSTFFSLGANSSGTYQVFWGGSQPSASTSSAVSTNTWTHIAFVRSGSSTNNCTIYIDGVSKASFTQTAAVPSPSTENRTFIGTQSYSEGANTRSFYGYMQDVRVTKGLARYTSNFTVPSAHLKG